MRISYNWIKALVPDLTHSPEELAELLTMHAFETEVLETRALDPNIRVARITALQAHPNADRLRLATVSLGDGDDVTVVCGAPNIAEGQVMPFSPPGTRLRDEAGETFVLKPVTIRGVESPGMLNSPRELGLGESHQGIYVLPEETPLGSALAEHIQADTILDIDMTPNRAHDSMSHRGVAREVAALVGKEVEEPAGELRELPALNEEWSLAIESELDTPVYSGVVMEDVVVRPSPLWMQARLWSAGMKPINAVVDITNYVMLELGNPTHAFDVDTLPGTALGVRRGRAGETLTTLDETTHTLREDNLVITSADQPVALAGVMGGADSQVHAATTRILLEVANFHPFTTWKSAVLARLHTEGSARWAKGVPPSLVAEAITRSLSLLEEIVGARLVGAITHGPSEYAPRALSFTPQRVARVTGSTIKNNQVQAALERLRFTVDTTTEPWQVTVPLERLDVLEEQDLVEEVIRVIGLETIKASSFAAQATPVALPDRVYQRELVRDRLRQLGFTETYNASFEPASFAAMAGLDTVPHVTVTNPPAPDLANLRVSLLPGLLANLKRNRELLQRNAGRKESALFEIGHVYQPGEGTRVAGVIETERVAGVIVGGVPSLANVAEELGRALGSTSVSLENKLTQALAEQLKFRTPVFAFEIELTELLAGAGEPSVPVHDIAALKEESSTIKQFSPFSKFPATYRDLSLLVTPKLTIEEVQEVIERVGGSLVVEVDLFDTYEPADRDVKGLAFHLAYQAFDRTLSNDEVAALHNKIVASLQEELGAEIRE